VRIIGKNESFEGTAMDIDSSGALLIKTLNGGVVKVLSGDVSIR
jgi:BirA family biotin operon repressor/biotin-[acetyl-CoA-carboxylase] ligase